MPWEEGNEPDDGALVPVREINTEQLQAIPLGAVVILVDHAEGTVASGTWDEVNRDHLLGLIEDAKPEDVSHLVMLYVPPRESAEKIADSLLPLAPHANLRDLLIEAARRAGAL